MVKGTRFEPLKAVKKKMSRLLRQLSENELQHAFDQSKIRMGRCLSVNGEFIERDKQ